MPDKDFKIVKISSTIRNEAEKVHTKAFMKAWDEGIPIRLKVQERLEKDGSYNAVDIESKAMELRKELKRLEVVLRKAKNADGTKMNRQDGKEVAMQMRKVRSEIGQIASGANKYFNETAESVALMERISFLVFACTQKLDGTPYWPTFEDYKTDTSSPAAEAAMTEVIKEAFGLGEDNENHLYENSWLIKQKFMDDKGRFLDDKGRLITEEGRLIDEKGNYVDEDGNRIDIFGNPIDADGNLLVTDEWATTETDKSQPVIPVAFPGTLPEGTVIPANNQ